MPERLPIDPEEALDPALVIPDEELEDDEMPPDEGDADWQDKQ